jgi:hypothetical protein
MIIPGMERLFIQPVVNLNQVFSGKEPQKNANNNQVYFPDYYWRFI